MPRSWSSSVDLHLEIDPSLSLIEGVAGALRAAIADGRLPAGAVLPSTRALAADLGIARGTVTAAYGRLVEQGHLASAQGTPTRVATGALPPRRPGGARRSKAFLPVDPPEVAAFMEAPRWDLRPGRPCTALFPREDWVAATRAVLARTEPADFDYPDVRGHPALREALARYLGRARGVAADPERIVVTSGFGAGLGLLSSVLTGAGVREVQVEDPYLPPFRDVLAAHVRVGGVAVDEHGLCVDAVTAPAVVTTPAHQYPLGTTMSPARRAALAARRDLLVIEDDYDGEFRLAATPVGALQGLAPDHVVYGGTASKALAPAVSMGWLVLPAHLVEPVATAARRSRTGPPALGQLILAEMLDSGRYDRQVRRTRAVYRRRRAALLGALAGLPVRPAAEGSSGLHVALLLPEEVAEADVLAAAAERGVGVSGLRWHWIDADSSRPGLVIGYAAPAEHAFSSAVAALADALRAVLKPSTT